MFSATPFILPEDSKFNHDTLASEEELRKKKNSVVDSDKESPQYMSLLTKDSGGHGSCLVPGQMVLPQRPWLVSLVRGQESTSGSTDSGSVTRFLNRFGTIQATGQVPGGQDWPQTAAEHSCN